MPGTDQSENQSQFDCTVAFPKASLCGLAAVVQTLDRRHATVRVDTGELPGLTVAIGDAVELDLGLPPNAIFGARTMNCIGRVAGVRIDVPGELWCAVRFHSLQFREVSAERSREPAVRSCVDIPCEEPAAPTRAKARFRSLDNAVNQNKEIFQ